MKERRTTPRITAQLAMEVTLSGGMRASAESINVSANGIYFSSKTFIEPLTKLQITLLLPKTNPKSKTPREVKCEGVVVRTEPETPVPGQAQYEIACYFTDIANADRASLESYILQQMPF